MGKRFLERSDHVILDIKQLSMHLSDIHNIYQQKFNRQTQRILLYKEKSYTKLNKARQQSFSTLQYSLPPLSDYNNLMSSNKFLQRFQGKIQVVSKEGVHNVFGGKADNVIVYTNNNFNQQNKNKTASSLNKPKPQPETKESKPSNKLIPHQNDPPSKKQIAKAPPVPPNKQKKVQNNPFLISNPFYLDEEDRERIERERKEREAGEKLQKEREREAARAALMQDAKKATNNNLNKSLDKKKNEKEWVKMGGLGANIGGDDWLQKKKKLDKMQEFSEQVKSINKDKPKVPKESKQAKKEVTTRQKALEYSKNVPKPVVRVMQQREEQVLEQERPAEEKLSELQMYQLKHEQYKNMLRNQL